MRGTEVRRDEERVICHHPCTDRRHKRPRDGSRFNRTRLQSNTGVDVMRRIVWTLAVVFAGMSLSCKKAMPTELAEVPRVKLGMQASDVLAAFSSKEVERTEKGIRCFDFNANSLPEGASKVRVLFFDNQLAYIEARLAPAKGANWTLLVTAPAKDFGAAKPLNELIGLESLEFVRSPSETAGWSDDNTVFAYVRDAEGVSVVLVKRAFVPNAKADIASVRATEEKATSAEAEERNKVDELKRTDDLARADAPLRVRVAPEPLSCQCIEHGVIQMKCQVSNASKFEMEATVQAQAETGFLGLPARGSGKIRIGPSGSQLVDINAQVFDAQGVAKDEKCGNAAKCTCALTSANP